MKNLLVFILIFSHLFSTVGFSMEVHDCGGNKEYTFYGFHIGESCSCDHESVDHSDACCKDKKTDVKAKVKEGQTSKIFLAGQAFDAEIPQAITLFTFKRILPDGPEVYYSASHPSNNSPPLYVLYGVYRI